MNEDIDGKRMELLSSVVPRGAHIAYLVNPSNTNSLRISQNTYASEAKAGRKLLLVKASTIDEVAEGISSMVKRRAGAFLVSDDTFLNTVAEKIAELALRHKLPSCFSIRFGTDGGGLLSFGVVYEDLYRRAATYVDKILKGEKPGDIPIEQPTTFEFVINLKTAKALGLSIPQSVLMRADRVIE